VKALLRRAIGRVVRKIHRLGVRVGLVSEPPAHVPEAFKVVIRSVCEPADPVGRALLTYICEPFTTERHTPEFRRHANYAQAVAIAEQLGERGYSVDVTHWRNPAPPDGSHYDLVFGLGRAFAAAASSRREGAIAIYFGTGTLANQTNLMQVRRDSEFNRRHHANVASALHDPDTGPACADRLLVTGDDWVVGSYSGHSAAPVSVCPNPIVEGVVDMRESKDFNASRMHFLWMAGYGGLRRRLDLVLEAFSLMPDVHLWVCGGLRHEKVFYAAMKHWLDGCENIHDVGWVDVGSERYREITRRCGFMIYPSVSDGCPGSVVNAMASGVVPLVTRETGIDVESAGIKIVGETVGDIVSAVRSASSMAPAIVERMSGLAVERACDRFSQARFEQGLRECLDLAGAHPVRR